MTTKPAKAAFRIRQAVMLEDDHCDDEARNLSVAFRARREPAPTGAQKENGS